MAECPGVGRNIYTLEDSLKEFDMECLLEQLDISLEHVRRNKISPEDHLEVLKSVNKNLLKQSRIYHPDKAIGDKKSDREIASAQKLQIALNATRTVLQALTEAFLEEIDIHYRYEFFAKIDISTMINEKVMDRQIKSVLYKISLLSEVKRVSIVGEIRKFLQESRKCLRSFQDGDNDEFERHRDYALRHLHKCIEGYKGFTMECELVVKECRGEHDGIARSAINKISEQSLRELNILRELEKVAEKSLDGKFQIYIICEPEDRYDNYLVSPFVLYINVMLMCTSVINQKSIMSNKFKVGYAKVKNWRTINSVNPQFNKEPTLFLKAYYLATYFDNKAECERYVIKILQNKALTIDNIIDALKDVVKKIEEFLTEEFDINTYKEGKSNREQFTEKLSKLNESMTVNKEAERELEEKLNLCKKETNEIRKEYFEFVEKFQETEQECRENILKCRSTSEEIAKLKSGWFQKKATRSIFNFGDSSNEIISSNETKKDSTERKLVKKLQRYEEIAENLLHFLIYCRQNALKFTEHESSCANENEYFPVTKEETEKKIKASCELSKNINEELYYLMEQTSSINTKQDNLAEENSENKSLKISNCTVTVDKIGESSGIYDKQCFDSLASEQNVTQNVDMNIIEDTPIFTPNTRAFEKEDSESLKKQKIEETAVRGKNDQIKEIFDPVTKEETEKKIKASYELSNNINEELHYLMEQTSPINTKQDNLAEENSESKSLKKSNCIVTVDKIGESSGIYDKQCFDSLASEQNVTQNTDMNIIEDTPIHTPNTWAFQKEDRSESLKKQKIEETVVTVKNDQIKEILDQKHGTKMVESYLLSNEQDSKGIVKLHDTEISHILNERNQVVKEANENLGDIAQSHRQDYF